MTQTFPAAQTDIPHQGLFLEPVYADGPYDRGDQDDEEIDD